jgi:activator of 2-hydroxyglutaryl-CoA dehydratase
MLNQVLNVGIDVGSTTVKMSIYEGEKVTSLIFVNFCMICYFQPIFEKYQRHQFDVENTMKLFFKVFCCFAFF